MTRKDVSLHCASCDGCPSDPNFLQRLRPTGQRRSPLGRRSVGRVEPSACWLGEGSLRSGDWSARTLAAYGEEVTPSSVTCCSAT